MPLAQIMELVMFSHLYAGVRGLGHVYRAVGDLLPAFAEPLVRRLYFRRGGRLIQRRSSAAWTCRRGTTQ
jgi:hypothetical protein